MAEFDISRSLDRDRDTIGMRPVSPTDISQFIRLDQCQRYLRLQLHSRGRNGEQFLEDYQVRQQEIPPILTRSGATFEADVERSVGSVFPSTHLDRVEGDRNHNQAVIGIIETLAPAESHVVFQPRLEARIDTWRVRGDIDLLLLTRDENGALSILIADMKSSTAAKVEHRLQVALYHEMITSILHQAAIPVATIDLAIVYRGPVAGTTAANTADPAEIARQREDARATLGIENALMERIDDVNAYIRSARDVLTGPDSVARRVLAQDFDAIPFHLTYKCDGCRFNEFCMKRSAETDDLSLIPFLTQQDKHALMREGIATVEGLADLKEIVSRRTSPTGKDALIVKPGRERTTRALSATWPVGEHLDELIFRAHSLSGWRQKDRSAPKFIPNRGFSSLPYSGPDQNPNMIRVYIDAQHDYLHDRIYMLGALVVASENGIESAHRRRSVIHLSERPPDDNAIEEQLFTGWINETIQAIVELAAPDERGEARAPIHLVFVNRFAQKQLLEGIGRHAERIFGATALYDFITQLASFNSPIASFLLDEVQKFRNYPMICQSLQAVAAYEHFDWNSPKPFRKMFHARLFDFWGRFDQQDDGSSRPGQDGWYTNRSRFNSQIPLEYAYVAWGDVDEKALGATLEPYAASTPDRLRAFHARRLDAMEHIARTFPGNRDTSQDTYSLPDLATFEERARTLAHALQEFVFIERHVEVAAWKHGRLPEPEQRVLNGNGLVLRYDDADQSAETRALHDELRRRIALRQCYEQAYLAEHPDEDKASLTKEQKAETSFTMEGMKVRMRIDTSQIACDLEDAIALSDFKDGARLILMPRWTVDSRLPVDKQTRFQPTFRQIQGGMRAEWNGVSIEPEPDERKVSAFVNLTLRPAFGGNMGGFAFGTWFQEPLVSGETYTLDPDINNYTGYWQNKTIEAILAGGPNAMYRTLTQANQGPRSTWTDENRTAQRRFLDGLDALREAGLMHGFEESKREFIARHGDSPVLLVQGPPGTGKSFTTAYALLARLQGAMATDAPFRVFLSCKTHAATDVLLENVLKAQQTLRSLFATHPHIMQQYVDPRLLTVPLFRIDAKNGLADGITSLQKGKTQAKENIATFENTPWFIAAGTPGAIYSIVKDRWGNKNLCGHTMGECLVLDEASQMSIPEALMAALPLGDHARIIVVGDHRQMPPIVSHDWANETRRTFQEFKSYESLFYALLKLDPPKINFEESFRLHADLAEFLRQEIYRHDGINYHSNLHAVLPDLPLDDDFVRAVLSPDHPLIVIVHDETGSQHRNRFEQELITPILETLADQDIYAMTPEHGLGVVVPHRAQRAALQEDLPALSRFDPETHERTFSAVDTVERFQGDERTVIFVSATESDPNYLLATGNFLLDPRRLTVALSRAKQKMVLIASRSIFGLFSADEEMFRNAQIWKNLLYDTCTKSLWSGTRSEQQHHVEVWGNARRH